MGNEDLKHELNNLERKVTLLLSAHSNLESENSQLKKENESLRIKLETTGAKTADFQNQVKISKIVESMTVEQGGQVELKEVIDDYIKEIDKCIAHLGEA